MEPAIIISVIGAVVSIGGSLLLFFTAKGNNKNALNIAQGDAKTKADARIDARVSEELDKAWAEIDELKEDLKDRDKKIAELERHMRDSEIRETEMYGYIQKLAAHILERKDPPPPEIPANLVAHFATE